MKVTRLVLDDFRNISHIDVNFAGNVNVILGKNAQGKTNMLESVYLFSQGKSFRASRDRDLIRFNSVKSNLQMEFSTDKREQLYEINLFSDKRRRIFLNEVEIKKYADMNGNFYTVLFAPEHLNLVKEGPSERRKFLDIAISSLKPRYFKATEDYSRLLIHKNALLRDIH
ncbi:MAG: DNA replication and repair protein RecF, partial [Bacillota bacterium]|nr:DNA replication and repair protein RecF [Bacillota bacterium]